MILALAMAGCSFTSTVTRTEAITSETVEVVEATEATEAELIVADLAFDNTTGVKIYGLYFSYAQNDKWGENLFANDEPLDDGYTRTLKSGLTYSADYMLWDMRIEDSEGATVDFRGLDLSQAADPHNITIVMTYNAEDSTYSASVK